jgi:hypothetical protein
VIIYSNTKNCGIRTCKMSASPNMTTTSPRITPACSFLDSPSRR